MHNHFKQKGFTLLEVLIALGILAVALTAVITTLRVLGQHAQQLEDKTLGHWVAGNILAQNELGLLQTSMESQQGQMKMLGHTWYWQLTTKPLKKDIKQIDVSCKNPQGFIIERKSYVYQQ